MTVSLFLVVKGGVALATATVGCSTDVLVLDGASNVGNVAVGCVETSVVVESPSADPSNVPPSVGTVAAVGVGTALTDRMFNLQGRIVVPPRSYAVNAILHYFREEMRDTLRFRAIRNEPEKVVHFYHLLQVNIPDRWPRTEGTEPGRSDAAESTDSKLPAAAVPDSSHRE